MSFCLSVHFMYVNLKVGSLSTSSCIFSFYQAGKHAFINAERFECCYNLLLGCLLIFKLDRIEVVISFQPCVPMQYVILKI